MVLGYSGYHRHQQREGDVAVGLEDCQEVVVFEEAHRAVCDLKGRTNENHKSPGFSHNI